MLFQIDGTLVVQLVNFAIFLALLNVVFLRPVGKAIAKRREYIEGLTHEYDTAQAAATDLRNQAERIRIDARRDAERILAQARAEASNEAAATSAEYGKRAQAIVDEAQATAARELEEARAGQQSLAEQLAGGILAKIVPEVGRA